MMPFRFPTRRAGVVSRKFLRRMGYDLVPSAFRTAITPLPPWPAEPVRTQRFFPQTDFWVPLNRFLHYRGFSFIPGGWHPHKSALEEYLQDPRLPFEETSLHRYHVRYRPGSLQEALLYQIENPTAPLANMPPTPPFHNPWNITRQQLRRVGDLDQSMYHAMLDGQKAQITREEHKKFRREHFLSVYNSIRRQGYLPLQYAQQPIRGYFLKADEDYRFVFMNGNHRLATLAVLGVEMVAVRLLDDHPAVIHADEVYRWTDHNGGIFPYQVGVGLLEHMLYQTGADQARYWQLES